MTIHNGGLASSRGRDASRQLCSGRTFALAAALCVVTGALVSRCDKIGRSCSKDEDCGSDGVCSPQINLCLSRLEEASPPVISTQSVREGVVGSAYEESLTALGGAGGYSWTLLNPPPVLSWLRLNAATGRLTGTPNALLQPGVAFSVQVRDSGSRVAERVFSLSVRNCVEGESLACAVALHSACFVGSQSCRAGVLGGCVITDASSQVAHCGPDCAPCTVDSDRCLEGVCRCGASDSCSGAAGTCCATNGGSACVDTRQNPDFCGRCGTVCDTDRPHVLRGCDGGNCEYPCAPNWGRCSPGARGCDTDLNQVENCGRCGRHCPAPDAGFAGCVEGNCAQGCFPGSQLCPPGTCFSLDDINHCGNCTQRCSPPRGGSATCINRVCGMSCPVGYNLCGTECISRDDQNNCGGCGQVCSVYGGRAVCNQGRCVRECPSGFNACPVGSGWQCISNDDAANCGGCGIACGDTQDCRNGRCVNCPLCGGQPCCGFCIREERGWLCG